jgi:hypothetical protein
MFAPAFTLVLTTSVASALKLAWNPQQSPNTFHSTALQPFAKFSTLSADVATAVPPAVVSTTVSVSPAVIPVSVVPCSCAAGTTGALTGLLLQKQLFSDRVHAAVGQFGPKLRSQYSMKTQGPLHWSWLKTNCCQP